MATDDGLLDRIADGRTDLVRDHVGRGHAATDRTRDGTRLLEWCAYYGDVSAVRFLLDHGESLASLGKDLGLNGAAFHGHWRLCEFLIENGADVNAAAPDTGETPLHAALSRGAEPTTSYSGALAHGASNRATRPAVPRARSCGTSRRERRLSIAPRRSAPRRPSSCF